MRARVTFLTKRPNGRYRRRPQEIEGSRLALGRGAGNDIHLPDLRAGLEHADLRIEGGELRVAARGHNEIQVNGQPARDAQLKPDDTVRVGPYEVRISEPEEGEDARLTVELVEAPVAATAARAAIGREEIGASGFPIRRWAWVLSLLVLGLFLAVPLARWAAPDAFKGLSGGATEGPRAHAAAVVNTVADMTERSWLSGELSDAHKMLAKDCGACHDGGFAMTRDAQCLACHEGIANHAAPVELTRARAEMTPLQKIAAMPVEAAGGRLDRCGACHKEHNRDEGVSPAQSKLCVACHADLDQRVTTDLVNVASFRKHPQFRATVVVDPAKPHGEQPRVSLYETERLVERSGLKFTHDKHLIEGGLAQRFARDLPERYLKTLPSEKVVLGCGDCHELEPGGQGFLPVTMKKHCIQCHKLDFDTEFPDRLLPHGEPEEIIQIVRDYYARAEFVQKGGAIEEPMSAREMLAAREFSSEEVTAAFDKAMGEADAAIASLFNERTCNDCHTVVEAGAGWTVAPVQIADRWLPKGRFDHSDHETEACDACHQVRELPEIVRACDRDCAPGESQAEREPLMVHLPGMSRFQTSDPRSRLTSCHDCHGSESAGSAVPSPCIMCHDYHQRGGAHPMGDISALRASSAPGEGAVAAE